MDNLAVLIGKKIKEQRKRLGMSQFELAEKVDVHEKQIYRIETGLNTPSISTVIKIFHALNMDIRVLDINNLSNFNPVKDEIYSLLVDAKDEELLMYRNVIEAIKKSQKITTKEKQNIKKVAITKQKKLTTKNQSIKIKLNSSLN